MARLEGLRGGDEEEDTIEAQLLASGLGHDQVRMVDRVERPA